MRDNDYVLSNGEWVGTYFLNKGYPGSPIRFYGCGINPPALSFHQSVFRNWDAHHISLPRPYHHNLLAMKKRIPLVGQGISCHEHP